MANHSDPVSVPAVKPDPTANTPQSAPALADHAPRFAGWSLAAAVAMLDGPREIVVVGRPGPARDALEAAARRDPTAVVVVARPALLARTTAPLSASALPPERIKVPALTVVVPV